MGDEMLADLLVEAHNELRNCVSAYAWLAADGPIRDEALDRWERALESVWRAQRELRVR